MKLPQLICLSTVISFGLCFHENKIRRINCRARLETCENQSMFHSSRNSGWLASGVGRLLWWSGDCRDRQARQYGYYKHWIESWALLFGAWGSSGTVGCKLCLLQWQLCVAEVGGCPAQCVVPAVLAQECRSAAEQMLHPPWLQMAPGLGMFWHKKAQPGAPGGGTRPAAMLGLEVGADGREAAGLVWGRLPRLPWELAAALLKLITRKRHRVCPSPGWAGNPGPAAFPKTMFCKRDFCRTGGDLGYTVSAPRRSLLGSAPPGPELAASTDLSLSFLQAKMTGMVPGPPWRPHQPGRWRAPTESTHTDVTKNKMREK